MGYGLRYVKQIKGDGTDKNFKKRTFPCVVIPTVLMNDFGKVECCGLFVYWGKKPRKAWKALKKENPRGYNYSQIEGTHHIVKTPAALEKVQSYYAIAITELNRGNIYV